MEPRTAPRTNPTNEIIQVGPTTMRFLVSGEDSGGSIAIFEFTVPDGARLLAPPHSHPHEETIYGLDGVLTFTIDGIAVDVGPGQALCIPRGAIHRFENNSGQDVKGICAATPACTVQQFFRDAAAIFAETPGGPPDRAKMMEMMRRHGIIPAPPPPHAFIPAGPSS